MKETALDLRYNISALAIAICSEKYMLPEEVFSIIEEKSLGVSDKDVKDMLKMKAEGMTYRQVAEIYGIHVDNVYGRIRRHRDRQKKDLSDGNLKRSGY